jgi:Na+/glutamate symporter
VERGLDAARGLAPRMRKGIALVLRHIVGSSVLSGSVLGGCFLRGGFGTAAATSSAAGAMLACDCWWNW